MTAFKPLGLRMTGGEGEEGEEGEEEEEEEEDRAWHILYIT